MARNRIVVVGASVMDMIAYAPRLPGRGETLHGTSFSMGFGGKGANQAISAAKLGANVSMISAVGSDSFGNDTLENFAKYGVDTTGVAVAKGVSTGVAPITVDAAGDNSILVVMGANDTCDAAHVRAATGGGSLADAAVVVAQLEIDMNASMEALRAGREAGALTILNTAPALAVPKAMVELADVLCPNEVEAFDLTGEPNIGTCPEAAARAADILLARGVRKAVVITRGKAGVLVKVRDEALSSSRRPRTLPSTRRGRAMPLSGRWRTSQPRVSLTSARPPGRPTRSPASPSPARARSRRTRFGGAMGRAWSG